MTTLVRKFTIEQKLVGIVIKEFYHLFGGIVRIIATLQSSGKTPEIIEASNIAVNEAVRP